MICLGITGCEIDWFNVVIHYMYISLFKLHTSTFIFVHSNLKIILTACEHDISL